MTFLVANDLWEERLEKKLKRIEKKCKKLGNDFHFEDMGMEIVEREEVIDGKKIKKVYEFKKIDVSAIAKVNDFQFVGKIEFTSCGNIVTKVPTIDVEIPKSFFEIENKCQHCGNKNSRRSFLYIVYNEKTKEFKAVGSSCLKLYTDGLNAEAVASYYDLLLEIEDSYVFGSNAKQYYPVDEILEYADIFIDKLGYMRRNEYDTSCVSTRGLVNTMYNDYACKTLSDKINHINDILKASKIMVEMTKKDFDFSKDRQNKIKSIKEYYNSLDANTDFIRNVQILLKLEYVTWDKIGFICYLPQGYNKYINDEKKRAEKIKLNEGVEYFGEEGKRYKDVKVKLVEYVSGWETMFGFQMLYRIITEDNNVLVWKTTKGIEGEKLENVKSITFTVKKHNLYNGCKQTEITRAVLK